MTDARPPSPAPGYRFDRFELRPAERALRADGQPVKLGGRAFDMLVALVERRDRVVGKHELMDIVWPKLVVEENNLQAQVVALRKLMGPAAIATVPGRGYRFTLAVETAGEPLADVGPSGPRESAAEPASAPAPIRHNLPRGVEALIGRSRELEQVQELIAAHRLVTVTGPGGVGKSRLVIDAAWASVDRFADGVWLVELAALADPALVPSAVTNALRIAVAPSEDPLAALTRQLGDRRLLIVLDNCEHVVDAAASALEAVLSAAPNAHALVSSQELIGIGGEHVLRLPSLAVPAEPAPSADTALAAGAVQLFVARARAADPRFVLDDRTAPKVAAICRRLDGIPLALEMAAARVPLLGIEGLAQHLDERFRVLTAGKRTALPRQRTLHATLDWSYRLLSPPERAVFRRLGVFAGPFTLAAAGAVATGDERDGIDGIECLSGLCDKSLVVADPDDVVASYRLLETTRVYAQERLAEASETATVTRRHAQHYRRCFDACFDDWSQLSDAAFRARYAPHLDNLRAAIAWSFGSDGDDESAVALVGSSGQLWLSLSLYAEAGAWVQRALERLAPSTPPALEADLWLAMARFHGQRNQQATIRASRQAADLYRGLGDPLRRGCALHALGSAHAAERDDEAEPVLLEARALLEHTGRPRLVAMAHGGASLFHAAHGRTDDAFRELQAALELYRAAGAEGNVLSALGSLADQAWMRGDLERSIRLARDTLEQHRQSPFSGRVSRAYAQANLFGMLVEHGDLAEAQAMGRRLLPELCELGIAHGWSDHYASCLARCGSVENAVRLVGWADALRLARGLRRQPNEERARDATLALARAGASAADLDRLLAEGAALREEDAHRLARP
ncbi:MAG: winged helix-turn-helix domain-containing protein [Betaproteobacteria bacterium]|nr:winged helix-turn-helix domain-containing protein [Betaproteobacteria bacterium]